MKRREEWNTQEQRRKHDNKKSFRKKAPLPKTNVQGKRDEHNRLPRQDRSNLPKVQDSNVRATEKTTAEPRSGESNQGRNKT